VVELEVNMSKIEPGLQSKLEAWKDSSFDLIVRVSEPPEHSRSRLESRGIQVRREFKLLPALAVNCLGQEALALAAEPWVLRVEEDKPVTTMPSGGGRLS
jgi:hypothetical protein